MRHPLYYAEIVQAERMKFTVADEALPSSYVRRSGSAIARTSTH
jgi:hypothetical protein